MARFFPGQRVRIKWSINHPELAGTEGETVRRSSQIGFIDGSAPDGTNWIVKTDLWHSEFNTDGLMFCPSESQLEPATDSYDVTSWDTCIWKPEHLHTPA